MNEEQMELTMRMQELIAAIPSVEQSGNPDMMKQLNQQLQQTESMLAETGVNPDEAMMYMQEQQAKQAQQEQGRQMLGRAHGEGRMVGQQEGYGRGIDEGVAKGMQQEVLRRSGSANPMADVGVVTNASRDLVEGLATRQRQAEAQQAQAQMQQQQQPQ